MALATVVIGALLLAVILCLVVLLAKVIVQQLGRLLVRLDSIENELVILRLQAGATPDEVGLAAPDDHALPESSSLAKSKIKRDGLEPGTPAPDFVLQSLENDGFVGPTSFRGRAFMLVLVAADCSPCEVLLQKLSLLSSTTVRDSVLVVARGSSERIQEKFGKLRVQFRVALEDGWTVPRTYATFRFPSAYVIDSQGVIASSLARGPEAIEMMARLFLSNATATSVTGGMYERADSVR